MGQQIEPTIEVENALDVIVARIITAAVGRSDYSDWENYPDLCEKDWETVVARVAEWIGVHQPPWPAVKEAYEVLGQRGKS